MQMDWALLPIHFYTTFGRLSHSWKMPTALEVWGTILVSFSNRWLDIGQRYRGLTKQAMAADKWR